MSTLRQRKDEGDGGKRCRFCSIARGMEFYGKRGFVIVYFVRVAGNKNGVDMETSSS